MTAVAETPARRTERPRSNGRADPLHGVQFGVQSERNAAAPRGTVPACLLGSTPSRAPRGLLGAGRSQVQILSPRLARAPMNSGLSAFHVTIASSSPVAARGRS